MGLRWFWYRNVYYSEMTVDQLQTKQTINFLACFLKYRLETTTMDEFERIGTLD